MRSCKASALGVIGLSRAGAASEGAAEAIASAAAATTMAATTRRGAAIGSVLRMAVLSRDCWRPMVRAARRRLLTGCRNSVTVSGAPGEGRASGRRRGFLGCGSRCQAPQEGQRFGRPGAGVGGVREDHQAGVEDEFEALVVELEVADLGVVVSLDTADVEAYVVLGPVLAELLAAGRQLPDEVGEIAVVR